MIPALPRPSPATRWAIAGLVAIAALAVLILYLGAREKADDAANQATGAAVQREATVTATLNQVRKADEAAETIRRDPAARDAECLRHARNPDDC